MSGIKVLRTVGVVALVVALLIAVLTGGAWALAALVLVAAATLALFLVLGAALLLLVVVFAPAIASVAVLLNPRFEAWLIRMRRLLSRRDVRRWLAFLGGVVAVLVPTLLTLFPAWGMHWKLSTKVAVVTGWLLTAGVIVLGTIHTSELLERLGTNEGLLLEKGGHKVERLLIKAVLSPANTSLGPDYAPQLFVPDRWERKLVSQFDPGGWGPEEGWRIGGPPHPVTVEAWLHNRYAHVKGAAVTGARYGLTPSQEHRYGELTGVAASPIQDASGRPLGVLVFLTALDATESRVGDADFITLHTGLAEVLARVLVRVGGRVGLD